MSFLIKYFLPNIFPGSSLQQPDYDIAGDPPPSSAENKHALISFAALVIFLMLMFYISVGIYIEQNKFTFGHEASITIVVGILISCV